jgi:hypothetical protein
VTQVGHINTKLTPEKERKVNTLTPPLKIEIVLVVTYKDAKKFSLVTSQMNIAKADSQYSNCDG